MRILEICGGRRPAMLSSVQPLSRMAGLFLKLMPVLVIMTLSGCSKEPSQSDLLTGSWFTKDAGVYTMVTFRANGSFTSSKRIMASASKVKGKSGKVDGDWEADGTQLVLRIVESEDSEVWIKDSTHFYEILEVSPEVLYLKSSDEKVAEWKRLKASGGAEPEIPSDDITIGMEPVVVNLAKRRSLDRDMYLCAEIVFTVEGAAMDEPVTAEGGPAPKPRSVHPRIRDSVLFYLGAQTHKAVSTFEKLKKVKDTLQEILQPYFDGKLKDIVIKNIVITSSWENVEDFLAEYSEPEPVEAETAEGEADEKQ